MAAVDSTIVATALPKIGSSLHARINWLGWTITIYSLGQIIMLPLAGRFSDQIGRKKLFLLCAVLFTVASVACGFANSIYTLVPLRFIQSIGGGGFLPSASGIVADHFGRERDRALGMFSSIFPIGGVAGPIFGGLITQYWDWRGIFFVNAPIGVALIVLIWRFVPSTARLSAAKIDVSGIALLGVMIVSGMLTVTTLGERGSTPLSPAVLDIGGICGAVRVLLLSPHQPKRVADHCAPTHPGKGLRGDERDERHVRRRRIRLRRLDPALRREPVPHRQFERGNGALGAGDRDDVRRRDRVVSSCAALATENRWRSGSRSSRRAS